MSAYRCEHFRRISRRLDKQIESTSQRIAAATDETQRLRLLNDLRELRRGRRTALQKHAERCPLCG